MASEKTIGNATFRDYLSLFALAMIWSSSFMAIKVAVDTVPPVTMTAGRMVIGAAFLFAVLLVKRQVLPFTWTFWLPCFILGLIGNGLPFTLIAWGEVRVDSGLAAILMAVMLLTTVLLAHFFSAGERLTRARGIGIGIGFSGVVILVGPEAVKSLGGDVWYQLSVSGGAVCYASVVYLGLLPTAIATLIYFNLLAARGAGFFAFINYLIPVMGVLWGMAALVTILAGLFVANWKGRRTANGSS